MNDAPRLQTSRRQDAVALGLGFAGAVTFVLGLRVDAGRAWLALLVASCFFLSLGLAGLVFIAIHRLAGAGWWCALRRIPEALTAQVPLASLPMLAVYLGRRFLYPWSHPDSRADPAVAAKSAYLNEPFFLIRMLLFLGLWSLFAVLLRRASLAEDREGGHAYHRRQARLSAVFIVVFAVTFSLASFDWLMSLDPHWASTMFAVYTFAGLFLEGLAAITLCAVLLRRRGPLADIVSESHLHDLGKLLFAFSTFWAYIWVCQYLLIWYGNLSEEISYYYLRTNGPWLPLFVLDPILNWGVPFVVLLPRAAKRTPAILLGVAIAVLAGRWLDLYLIAAPAVLPEPRLGLLELLITAGLGGVFFLGLIRSLAGAPLLARYDPFLEKTLHHHV
ncbi:MAG TPA: hypothetical protein VGX68_21250 [Thermoanaerobaculia bacterium]|jgi:hypothetical protein|nr:hypothetical protein [Thermoanaerobaculia bacterium]